MTELTRQSWLKAMGFTAWVAQRPLPGAAASPQLEWPEEAEPVEPQQRESMRDMTSALRGEDKPLLAEPRADRVPVEKPPVSRAPRSAPLTLLAYPAGDLWLLVQPARADAPEPGREEQRLLASLLRLWGCKPQRPRRFANPPGNFDQQQTAEAVRAFIGALGQHGARRLLCCVDEQLAAMLGEGGRYRPASVAGLNCLPVSSLAEMLAEPLRHKRSTWLALQEAGFAP